MVPEERVDGNHILYHFLQKGLRERDRELYEALIVDLVESLAIWFSPDIYCRAPVLAPYAVRDNGCRPRRSGDTDAWGEPDGRGYFRDDNSLIKGLPRSLRIRSAYNPLYDGRRLGKGYVASHVWRVASGESSVSSDTHTQVWLNSFVPNLVWLPVQVAKLSDREGSFVQLLLQALAHTLYRHLPVPSGAASLVEALWKRLPQPKLPGSVPIPPTGNLSYFEGTASFVQRRIGRIRSVLGALGTRRASGSIGSKVISRRYTAGLNGLPWEAIEPLFNRLSVYADALGTVKATGAADGNILPYRDRTRR